jgi:hypothetical protein
MSKYTYPKHVAVLNFEGRREMVSKFMLANKVKRMGYVANETDAAEWAHKYNGRCYKMVGNQVYIYDTTVMVLFKTMFSHVMVELHTWSVTHDDVGVSAPPNMWADLSG